MSQHSPGPWEVGYRAMNVMASDDKGSFPVCDIRGWGHLTGRGHGALGLPDDQAVAIQTANARLIAAAPEMLEALKRCEQMVSLGFGPPNWDWVREVIAMAAGGKGESK